MNTKKNVVITGGSGHIGVVLAEAFLLAGDKVALVDRNTADLERARKSLEETVGVTPQLISADLSDDDAPTQIVTALDDWNGVDTLVHAAAFVGTTNLEGWVVPFEEQSVATWEAAIKVNLTAVFAVTQKLLPLLNAAESPSVINISSIYGVVGPDYDLYEGVDGMGNPAAYAASKGGMNQLTRWMASTLAPKIRVNSLNLGGIFREQDPRFVARYIKKVPLGRMGTENDVTGPVLFLAGQESLYLTGQCISLDGGYTIV